MVLFGSISSPFLLAIILQKIIEEDIVDSYVRKTLRETIYVDNLNCCSNNEDLLTKLYVVSRKAFMKRGFNLRKWSSSGQKVKELAKADGVLDERETIGVLGLQWGPKDTLSYNKGMIWNGKNTKRSVLAFTNGMFDPLNRLIPIAI